MAIKQFELDVLTEAADEMRIIIKAFLDARRKGRLNELKLDRFLRRLALTYVALQVATPASHSQTAALAELGTTLENMLTALRTVGENRTGPAAIVKQRGERALELLRRITM